MPLYFYNIHDGRDIPDKVGTVLPGPKEARDMAVTAAAEALKDLDGRFWNAREWRLDVTNETGATVCRLRMTGEFDQG